jgi:hypothetical protein
MSAMKRAANGYIVREEFGTDVAWIAYLDKAMARRRDQRPLQVVMDETSVPDRASSTTPEREARCPTCDSPDPKRHPAVQFEGEVSLCGDPWHVPSKEQIEASWRVPAAPEPPALNGQIQGVLSRAHLEGWTYARTARAILSLKRAAPEPPALDGLMAEHRLCGTPNGYDGCYSHWPMDHCRADGMAWPCDVDRIRARLAAPAGGSEAGETE